MKRLFWVILTIFCGLLGSLSLSCSNDSKKKSGFNKEKPYLLCTTIPLYCFTKAIAGELAQVELLPPPEVGPHGFTLSLKDRQRIENADILITNGLGLETALPEQLIHELEDNGKYILQTGNILPQEKLFHFEDDHHHHDHGDHHDHHHHGHYDPHIWLFEAGALGQLKAIQGALIKLHPQQKQAYTKNLQDFAQKLQKAYQEAREELKALRGTKLFTFHDAWRYFAQDFGFEIQATLFDQSGQSKGLSNREKIERMIKEKEIQAIFIEPQFDRTLVDAILEDNSIPLIILDPGVTTDKPLQASLYLETLKENVKALKQAFPKASRAD